MFPGVYSVPVSASQRGRRLWRSCINTAAAATGRPSPASPAQPRQRRLYFLCNICGKYPTRSHCTGAGPPYVLVWYQHFIIKWGSLSRHFLAFTACMKETVQWTLWTQWISPDLGYSEMWVLSAGWAGDRCRVSGLTAVAWHTLNFLYKMWGQICACCSLYY